MKMVVVSDLHLEGFPSREYAFEELMNFRHKDYSDCVGVFAGDILTKYEACKFLDDYRHLFKEIVYVPGNHDLWYASTDDIGTGEYDIAGKSIFIDDVQITGAVGWPMQHGRTTQPLDDLLWGNSLYERELITHKGNYFTYDEMLQMGNLDATHIFNQPKNPDIRKHVVVAHYPPSWKSINPRFEESDINYFFASNHDDYGLFVESDIDLYIHGHTHYAVDYMIENTRVLSNPRGYNFEHIDFKPIIIEI